MNNFPAMTEEQRVKLVNWLIGQRDACDELHGDGCTDERCVTSKIALAALTATPVAYMYKDRLHSEPRFSSHTRFGNWSQEDINEYEITETKLYTAPPAPVLRVPDELKVKNGSHQSHIDYAEGWADCIDEVKRLNTQPSPPEASNEQ